MNNGINNDLINEIRNSVDIVDIISNYVDLKSHGKNYFGVCPFHSDTNPSMSVSKDKQIYTCFSCHATGNVFNFLMNIENITFIEALKKCADIGGINVNIGTKKNTDNEKFKPLYDIYIDSEKFYQNALNTKKGIEAKEYLLKRGIDETIIKEFKIGLALKERNVLTKFLQKKNHKEKDLLRTGLFSKNSYGLNDLYIDRIMFPLENIQGKIVGYSGRVYHGEEKDKSKPVGKYINTSETEIFKKGEMLYNYTRSKNICRELGTVIVMEGFMDVIASFMAGIKNTVAPMGTAVTKNQAELIKKMAKEVILCFDGDNAGQKATYSCSNQLIEFGVTPKVVCLEDGLDPDEYIKKYGVQKFKDKISNPIDVIDFKLEYLKKDKNLNNSDAKAEYVNNVITEINKLDNDIIKEITLQKLSNISNLSMDILKKQVKLKTNGEIDKSDISDISNIDTSINSKKIDEELPLISDSIPPVQDVNNEIAIVENPKYEKKQAVEPSKIEKLPIKSNKYLKAEKFLLYYMLKSKEVIRMYDEKITYMPTERYRKLAYEISFFYKKNNYIQINDLISSLKSEQDIVKTIGEIVDANLKENYSLAEITDYINVIREYNIKEAVKNLTEKLKKEKSALKKAEILMEIQRVKKGECTND